MIAVTVAALLADAALLFFTLSRLWRSRGEGASLRIQIFASLAIATLLGALVTGLVAVAEDAYAHGVAVVAARVAPKALLLATLLLGGAAAGAALVGRRLSRSVEELAEAASRIAEGHLDEPLPRGRGREMRSLARALSSMRSELEGRPYAAAFLRDAWHDLKTPAAAMKATVEVLEDGALDDPAEARRFVSNLRRSSEQLERTLDDLVTLARLETSTTKDDVEVAVGELARDACEALRPLADARGTSLVCDDTSEGALLRCDPDALTRALSNLIDNAIAASPGGRVELTAAVTDAAFCLEVANSPGEVPEEMRARLFHRAATSRKGAGSGLGLAIARAAVEAHRGRIKFVSMGPPRVALRIELPR
ncbi:MAG: HAMP domain-containing protein [Polyangiaceae bacterium]|nr:HAMP domain-containing protein [Polyangiaceae bacterium]